MSNLLLNPAEARVLASLVEKSITTPQYYPLTVNSLMLAANQKSSRAPVMNLTEGDVGAALNRLEADKIVSRDDLSARATKWRHHVQHFLLLKPGELAVLATLMLRGPQTLSELRSHSSVLGGPPEIDAMTAVMNSLEDRAQPLVMLLPKSPGQSSGRYAHLLCGKAGLDVMSAPPAPSRVAEQGSQGEGTGALTQRIETLEARVADLERKITGQISEPSNVA